MPVQVDGRNGLSHSAHSGFNDGVRGANERDHRPVVVRVHRAMQNRNQRHAGNCIGNGIDNCRIPPF